MDFATFITAFLATFTANNRGVTATANGTEITATVTFSGVLASDAAAYAAAHAAVVAAGLPANCFVLALADVASPTLYVTRATFKVLVFKAALARRCA